jgi:transcription initiation factor TFIIB
MMRCPSCGSIAVFHDSVRGEEICTRCGLVILERVTEEKRELHEESVCIDPSLGEDPSLHDFGLGSEFYVPRDLPPSTRAKLRRMRSMHSRARVHGWEERSLRSALMVIGSLCKELGLPPEVRREASYLYRKVRSKGLTVGRNQSVLCLALCHIVSRLRGFPQREREMQQFLSKRGLRAGKEFRRMVKVLCRELGLRLPSPSAVDYVDKYASLFRLPPEVVGRARQMAREVRGKSPHLLACAALYRAARDMGCKLSLREMVELTGVGLSSLSRTAAQLERLSAE